MPVGDIAKSLVRPPFANYDIVVYFGCGLFALPFIQHYVIEPLGMRFPRFDFQIQIPFAGVFISTLALLFSVYILGHMLAYIGSLVIEKTVELFLGKVSSVILLTSGASPQDRHLALRQQIRRKRALAFTRESWFGASVRAISHFPVWPFYFLLVWIGEFGLYASRVPPSVIEMVKRRVRELKFDGVVVEVTSPWFKVIEGYVINNNSIATARMYNYLVIAGLFRSIATLILASLWAEIIWFTFRVVNGGSPVENFMTDSSGVWMQLVGYVILTIIYIFALFSYLKFQRRYVEEAIFAFALSKDA